MNKILPKLEKKTTEHGACFGIQSGKNDMGNEKPVKMLFFPKSRLVV